MAEEINWGLVLFKLDSIAKNQESFSIKLDEINKKLNELEKTKDSVEEIEDWKEKLNEVFPISKAKSVIDWKDKLEEKLPFSKIDELLKWKTEIDEITSTKQLKEHITSIEDLKVYKTKASNTWWVVNTILGMLVVLISVYEFFFKK